MKLKSVELDNDHIIVNSANIEANMLHASRIKRSRKSIHPSKTIKLSMPISFTNQLTQTSFHAQAEESSNSIINSTDDELSNLTQFDPSDEQENNDVNGVVNANEGSSILNHHHNVSSKRPRLIDNKRLEANARERERVHNLTAAFEALRQAIPMHSDQAKLSRLSILRIACSYVHVLGALNDIDFSQGQHAYTFNESFHMLSCTILNELKRKRHNYK